MYCYECVFVLNSTVCVCAEFTLCCVQVFADFAPCALFPEKAVKTIKKMGEGGFGTVSLAHLNTGVGTTSTENRNKFTKLIVFPSNSTYISLRPSLYLINAH